MMSPVATYITVTRSPDESIAETMDVKVNYSNRRLRTVSARMVDGVLIVDAPATMARGRLEKIVDKFKASFERKRLKEELNRNRPLVEIAAKLNQKYFDDKLRISSIEYSAEQNSRFGCCQCREGVIRISHRLNRMPDWVRDYVIIHEMAHLIEPNHSANFWNIVSRYELAERAKGYLMAVGLDSDSEE